MKSTTLLLLSAFSILFSTPYLVKADDSGVSFSAVVMPAPTINDFDRSNIDSNAVSINNSGSVKGVSTKAENDSTLKIILFELGTAFLMFLFYNFVRRKHRLRKSRYELVNNTVQSMPSITTS